MAPRRSTRARKAVVTNFDFELSDDDARPSPKKAKRTEDSDEDQDFEVQATAENDGDPDEYEEPPAEESDSPSEPDAASDVDADADAAPRRALPGRDRRPQATTDPNAIEAYPFSKKTTRAYEGPLKRQRKTPYILEYMYGPEAAHTELACGMLNRWYRHDVRPGREGDGAAGPIVTPWVGEGFERGQGKGWRAWMGWCEEGGVRGRQRAWEVGEGDVEGYIPRPKGDLAVLLGPYGDQDEVVFRAGEATALPVDDHDLPISGDDGQKAGSGWVFDVGGIVPSLSWVPQSASGPQYLALCVVPHSDQEHPSTAEREPHKGSQKHGTIQLWRFDGRKEETGEMVPSAEPPVLVRTLCFDWGRARRVRWCPVPSADEAVLGLLGILTGDGKVRVLEISRPGDDERGSFYKVEESMFTLSIDDEQSVEATALAWANTNRLVVGYTDGSVALWSLHPHLLLSRHPLHSTYIIDLSTGYPSRPYLVTSVPIYGLPTLADLSHPTHETTSFVRNSITTQPNLLQWSDHLQGFFSCYPSGAVVETAISFMHHRYFPHLRRVVDLPGQLTCLAGGYSHPFLLVGSKDGSVWACNAAKKLFSMRTDRPMKQRVFEHEYRPAERFSAQGEGGGGVRGAARILGGWGPEQNSSRGEPKKKPAKRAKGPKPKRGRPKKKKEGEDEGERMDVDEEEAVEEAVEEEAEVEVEAVEGEAKVGRQGKSAMINHEPLTRIMVMEWNPNLECGCWAAVAAASGIVRIMDLGVTSEN